MKPVVPKPYRAALNWNPHLRCEPKHHQCTPEQHLAAVTEKAYPCSAENA